MSPGETLGATIDRVLVTLDPEKRPAFVRGDSLIVPMLNFDITRTYAEIVGKEISGARGTG